MKNIIISEEQFERVLKGRLNEDDNPLYNLYGKNIPDYLKVLFKQIETEQNNLYKQLTQDIDDLTKEKANAFNTPSVSSNLFNGPVKIAKAGNNKVPENVLIVNITSALGCPSFYLGQCLIKDFNCYAMRDENQFPSARNRSFQTDLMNTELLRRYQKNDKSAMKKYFSIIEMYLNIGNAKAKKEFREIIDNFITSEQRYPTQLEYKVMKMAADRFRIKHIRINEAGDFPCQLSANLWMKFAKKVGRKYGINVHAYTARNFDFSKKPENMSIIPSNKTVNIGKEPYRTFIVNDALYHKLKGGNRVNPKTKQPEPLGKHYDENGTLKYYYKCPCATKTSKCDKCQVCFYPNKTGKPYMIYVLNHAKHAQGLKNIPPADKMNTVINSTDNLGWITNKERNKFKNGAS